MHSLIPFKEKFGGKIACYKHFSDDDSVAEVLPTLHSEEIWSKYEIISEILHSEDNFFLIKMYICVYINYMCGCNI